MWSICEAEESENSSSVPLADCTFSSKQLLLLLVSHYSHSSGMEGSSLNMSALREKSCKCVSVQRSPGECWLSFVILSHFLSSCSLGRAEMPLVKAVLGAGWKHLSQKRPKLLHTAAAKTDSHKLPQELPPAQSFFSFRNKIQTNEMTNLHWDFSIKLAVDINVGFSLCLVKREMCVPKKLWLGVKLCDFT